MVSEAPWGPRNSTRPGAAGSPTGFARRGRQHAAHGLGAGLAQLGLRVAQQRLPEHPALEEVEVLLALEDGGCAELLGQDAGVHLEHVGLGEEAQPVAGGVRDEVREQQRLVVLRQLVVEDRRVGLAERPLGLPGESLSQVVAAGPGRVHRLEQRPRLRDPLLRLADLAQVPAQHLARDLAQVPARQHVIGHVRDAVGRQTVAAGGEQCVAAGRRDPRVDAVRDDEVERAERAQRAQVRVLELDVLEAQSGRRRGRPLDRAPRQVDPAERAAAQPVGHRHEVAAITAAELEQAAGVGRRGAQPEQRGHRGEAVRVRLRERMTRVRDPVVVGQNFVLALRSHPAETGASNVPSAFWARYSTLSLA